MTNEIIKEGEFEYIRVGKGEPMVLLHGLFGEFSNFEYLIDHFSSKYEVFAPLMPLYKMPILTTGVGTLSKHIAKFIAFKKLENITLLGNSLGGHVALIYSKDNPDKVKNLILTGSSGLYENAFGGSFPRKGDKDFLRKRIEITFYDQSMVTDELVDNCHELVNDREKLFRILKLAKSAIRHNMEKSLPDFKMPVCLIWGKNDQITPPDVAELFNKLIPNSTLYWIDECGHAPMMEKPADFNNHLDNWLSKVEQ